MEHNKTWGKVRMQVSPNGVGIIRLYKHLPPLFDYTFKTHPQGPTKPAASNPILPQSSTHSLNQARSPQPDYFI